MAQTKTKKPSGPVLMIQGKPVTEKEYPPLSGWRLVAKEESKYRERKGDTNVDAIRRDEHGIWEMFKRDRKEHPYTGCATWTIRWLASDLPDRFDDEAEDDDECGWPCTGAVMFAGGETYQEALATAAIVDSWLAKGLPGRYAALLCDHLPAYGNDQAAPPYYASHGRLYADACDRFRALDLEGLPEWTSREHGPAQDYASWCAWDRLFFKARMHAFLTDEEQESGEGPVWDALNRRDLAALDQLCEERAPALEAAWDAHMADVKLRTGQVYRKDPNTDPEAPVPEGMHLCLGCGKHLAEDHDGPDATGEFCTEECMDAFDDEQEAVERAQDAFQEKQEREQAWKEAERAASSPVPAATIATVTKAATKASQLSLF